MSFWGEVAKPIEVSPWTAFWEWWGGFWASFDGPSWTTFAFSLLALFGSWFAVYRSRTQKPKWVIEWDWGPDGMGDVVTDAVRCVARNRGGGTARDVVLKTMSIDGKTAYSKKTQDSVAFNEEVALWYSFEDGARGGLGRGDIHVVHPDTMGTTFFSGEYASSTVKVQLTWHQAPRFSKPRGPRRARYVHGTNPRVPDPWWSRVRGHLKKVAER